MKILHVYKTFLNDTMGGTQQVIASITRHCKDSNIKFSVLSLSDRNTGLDTSFAYADNLHYKESFSIASNPCSFSLLKDFGKIIKNYDLIHYHFPWPFADLLNLVWGVSKPSIITYHSDIVKQKNLLYLYQPLMHNFLSSANAIVATSQNYVDTSEVLQKYLAKIQVIPIGINRMDYPISSIDKINYWKNIVGDKFFLFVGVMRYYKGLDVLLDASKDASFSVVIVGSGPIEDDLKLQAKKLNLTNVHFLGALADEDKVALLELSFALVFPSNLRSEAFGISLLEGAMFGKPLISAEIGTGTSFINIHQETGLVVPPSDANALKLAMNYLWNNLEAAKLMGYKAKERFNNLFTAATMSSRYVDLYNNVISKYK